MVGTRLYFPRELEHAVDPIRITKNEYDKLKFNCKIADACYYSDSVQNAQDYGLVAGDASRLGLQL